MHLAKRSTVVFTFLMLLTAPRLLADNFIWSKEPFRERMLGHINGVCYHFSDNREELNELNYGLGFSYLLGEFSPGVRWLGGVRAYAEFDAYSDSYSDLGYLFAVALQHRFWGKLDWGANIGFVHEDSLHRKTGMYLHPFVIPYFQTNFDCPLNLRLVLIPPVNNDGVIALQAITRF